MGKPISLGSVFGIEVRLDVFVLLVAGLFVFMGLGKNPTLQNVINQTTFVILLFVSIFLHEMGHAAGARLFGIRTLAVTLTFFGGVTHLATPPRRAIEDIVVSFAGPAANLAISGLLYVWLKSEAAFGMAAHAQGILWRVQELNLILGILNLIPGYPLDGGNIARAMLGTLLPMRTARLAVAYIGVAVGFGIAALDLATGFGYGLMIGVLLVLVASQEIQAARSSRF